jgi:hypothetical protein
MAKKFFYVCGGLLMLALAYHFGATTATAQAPGNPVVGIAYNSGILQAVTANGDAYTKLPSSVWTPSGNVFGGSPPVPDVQQSWGQVKARYR